MTNAKFHRCERALDRITSRSQRGFTVNLLDMAQLTWTVGQYRLGFLRAKNGRGAGLHNSGALA